MPLDPPTPADELRRSLGFARNGIVTLRDFDEGVFRTLRGAIVDRGWYINFATSTAVPPAVAQLGAKAEPARGVPLIFYNPEDELSKYRAPFILARRTSIEPALQRFHPGQKQYRVAGVGSVQRQVGTRTGPSSTEELEQAEPYDISYDVVIVGKWRGVGENTGQAHQINDLLRYVLRCFKPGSFLVRDSVGDIRQYEVFTESVSDNDDVLDIGDRSLGYSVTIRVQAELDILDPATESTIIIEPTITIAEK